MKKTDRRAVISGAASGIGEATTRRFAAGNYEVIMTDLNAERGEMVAGELAAAGHVVSFHRVDMADQSAVAAFSSDMFGDTDAPDVLVNCAGILQNATRVLTMQMSEFDKIMDVNLRGTIIASREIGGRMCRRGSGSIINLCSLTTFRASAQVAYALGKSSLRMLTEITAAEFGPAGVRVNAVAPGYTLTPAMQARIDSGERNPEAVISKSALGRFVLPDEVANAIFFLCSSDAGAITGVTLPIDCGWLVSTAYQSYAAQPS